VTGLEETIYHYGPKYFSFTRYALSEHSNMALHLESEVPMDVYVSRDKSSDPNQFQNDVTYKQTSKLTLRTNDLEFLQNGYTVTVYAAAIDEHANTLLYNTLRVSFEDSSHTPYAGWSKKQHEESDGRRHDKTKRHESQEFSPTFLE